MIEARKETEFVECEMCSGRVRRTQAPAAQLDDETVYFCCAECYEDWEAERRVERTGEAGEP
jgi:hypothetical protein